MEVTVTQFEVPTWILVVALTAFLGVIAGLLLLARRNRPGRRRKGHCPSCNYDRRGLSAEAACPECGAKP